MEVEDFIGDRELKRNLRDLKRRFADKQFSDVVDDEGNQYVDLVMEGGGMLGIALVGYTYVLEQMGIRFLGIGGTSAGSINALLLAALDEPVNAKSPKLLQELANKNFYDFVDGDSDARDFTDAFVEGAGKFKMAIKGMQVVDNLTDDLGLHKGEVFTQWITQILKREGISTLNQLNQRITTLPQGLRKRDGEPVASAEDAGLRLAIVAADISTETKVVFPDMGDLYWANPDVVNPANFVRASMSIPFFFHPYRIKNLPQGEMARKRWEGVGYRTDHEGGLPTEAMFVDGGIMSNFPIDVFHVKSAVPSAPTFGVKLQYDRRKHFVDNPMGLAGAIFNAARHTMDYDFIRRNPDYRHLVTWIPAVGFNWLDFNMDESTRAKLFLEGAREAIRFLERFNWEQYKQIRRGIASANVANETPGVEAPERRVTAAG